MFGTKSYWSLPVLALVLTAAAAAPRSAVGCDTPRRVWKAVTTYVDVEVPATRRVVRYDDCGRRVVTLVDEVRTVSNPETKTVRICY